MSPSIESTKSVLVTGASGFVGTALCSFLANHGYVVRRGLRRVSGVARDERFEDVELGDLAKEPDLGEILGAVDYVVHLAARVHEGSDTKIDAPKYRKTNINGTMALADAAIRAGVRRFVYLSTIKAAMGEDGIPHSGPGWNSDPYGQSKWEAEQLLAQLASGSPMEFVIVRPPLVFGPGVGANFLSLLRVVDTGIPLPLSGIANRRSLVGVTNLCDFIEVCLHKAPAKNRAFFVSDDCDVSTSELMQEISRAFGRPARLFWLPKILIRLALKLMGRGHYFDRLFASLYCDLDETHRHLFWSPSQTTAEELTATINWYKSENSTTNE